MLNPKQSEFLALASSAAVAAEALSGVPAELTTAQAILESGWGRACPGNNCFGIKATPRNPRVVTVTTQEVFTQEQLANWKRHHPTKPVRIIGTVTDGRMRVELDDAFAAFDDLAACFIEHDHLLTQVEPYESALADFKAKDNLAAYIERVAVTYATDPNYAKSIFALLVR